MRFVTLYVLDLFHLFIINVPIFFFLKFTLKILIGRRIGSTICTSTTARVSAASFPVITKFSKFTVFA